MTNAEKELAGYFAKYEPAKAKLGKALRAKLRGRLPGLFEVVYFYANQGALVIAYSPSENGYEGVCSTRLDPDGAKLFFTQGALLAKSDPNKLLKGKAGVRHVALDTIKDFDRPEIEALMAAALKLSRVQPKPGAEGAVILKAEKQEKRASKAAARRSRG